MGFLSACCGCWSVGVDGGVIAFVCSGDHACHRAGFPIVTRACTDSGGMLHQHVLEALMSLLRFALALHGLHASWLDQGTYGVFNILDCAAARAAPRSQVQTDTRLASAGGLPDRAMTSLPSLQPTCSTGYTALQYIHKTSDA